MQKLSKSYIYFRQCHTNIKKSTHTPTPVLTTYMHMISWIDSTPCRPWRARDKACTGHDGDLAAMNQKQSKTINDKTGQQGYETPTDRLLADDARHVSSCLVPGASHAALLLPLWRPRLPLGSSSVFLESSRDPNGEK